MFCIFPIPSSLKVILQRSLGTHISAHCIPVRRKILFHSKSKQSTLARIHSILATKVCFIEPNLPNIPTEPQISIEECAMRVRQHWELGDQPIANMVSLLEAEWYHWSVNFPPIVEKSMLFINTQKKTINRRTVWFLALNKHSFYRRQFNCAHELGHIILHERYDDLNEIDRDEYRRREDEANAFAAAFLLPARAFGRDVSVYPNKLSHYHSAKEKMDVSIMAMLCGTLWGIFHPNQYSI